MREAILGLAVGVFVVAAILSIRAFITLPPEMAPNAVIPLPNNRIVNLCCSCVAMRRALKGNAPCPCESGKKYRDCCRVNTQPEAVTSCFANDCVHKPEGRYVCRHCPKAYVSCDTHKDDAATALQGHVIRLHPESVPEVVKQIAADGEKTAEIERVEAQQPGEFTKLLAAIHKLRAAC
jgi:hypothetical protein